MTSQESSKPSLFQGQMIPRTQMEQSKKNPQIETLSQMNPPDEPNRPIRCRRQLTEPFLSFNPLTEKEIQESTKAETWKGDETEMGI